MIKRTLTISALAAIPAIASASLPNWPQGSMDEKDPRVGAFYQAQCAAWSDQAGRKGEDRQKYQNWCVEQMASLRPVGFEEDKGGGDE